MILAMVYFKVEDEDEWLKMRPFADEVESEEQYLKYIKACIKHQNWEPGIYKLEFYTLSHSQEHLI